MPTPPRPLASHETRPRKIGAFARGLALTVALACASPAPPELPPLTSEPTPHVFPGKFVWMDLVTQDVGAARAFYGALFGWTFREGDRYTEVLHAGAAIAGIISARDPEQGSEWIGNLSVLDVDSAARIVARRGGVIERAPTDAPDRGRLALVSDREGALLLPERRCPGTAAEFGLAAGRADACSGWCSSIPPLANQPRCFRGLKPMQ